MGDEKRHNMHNKGRLIIVLWLTVMAVIAEGRPIITVKTMGDVPQQLTIRVVAWVDENIGQVTNAGRFRLKAKKMEDVSVKLNSKSSASDIVLALVAGLDDESRLSFVSKNIVVLNLVKMKTTDFETYARRVEKEAVGEVASALGLPECPLMACALHDCETVDALDDKSRNLCPPCRIKLIEILKRRDQNP